MSTLAANKLQGLGDPTFEYHLTTRRLHLHLLENTTTLTPISASDTWAKVVGDGSYVVGSATAGFTFDAPNEKVVYNGAETQLFKLDFAASFVMDGAGDAVCDFAIYKNGVLVPDAKSLQVMSSNTDETSNAIHGFVSLQTDDELEIYVRNTTSSADVLVRSLMLVLTKA